MTIEQIDDNAPLNTLFEVEELEQRLENDPWLVITTPSGDEQV